MGEISAMAGLLPPSAVEPLNSVSPVPAAIPIAQRSMGSHQSARMVSDTWLTPPTIIRELGEFDLDPCCPPVMPWRTAARTYTPAWDGLAMPWAGRVWLNPPYSREAVKWLRKMAEHGNGIVLTFARTETAWFFETIWRAATAVLFLEGRIHFHHPCGKRAAANAGAPSVLAAYGESNAVALKNSGLPGQFVALKHDAQIRALAPPDARASGASSQESKDFPP